MIYTLTIGLSAFLLFLLQPLISKMLLPWFGGGATTWITSLVFFQALLVLGYGITHWLIRRFGLYRHLWISAALLTASLIFMPISVVTTADPAWPPSMQLFLLLIASVGVPYLMLATTSPTLQSCIANDPHAHKQNPYIQYGVSNAGSLLGLLAYPFLLEPFLTNGNQSLLWTALYAGYALLFALTIGLFLHQKGTDRERRPPTPISTTDRQSRRRWMFQAMVPSALLLVTTHYLTLDVVNLPLLWVAPLAVYLITFVVCFLFPAVSAPGHARSSLAIASILFLVLVNQRYYDLGFTTEILAVLTCLFFVCMVFHGDLERGKPNKQQLTGFYLQLALGGSFGSILAGVVAPMVFNSNFEFQLTLVVALYYVVASRFHLGRSIRPLFRAASVISIVLSYIVHETTLTGGAIYQQRSFYGSYTVRETSGPEQMPVRRLVAGTHVHGEQFMAGPRQHDPIAYYHTDTGLAHVFESMQPRRVAAVGLSAGSVVEYGNADTHFDIYELDPLVVDIASRWFTILADSPSSIRYIVGDGRLMLRQATPAGYDLVILDAFTSGSIPTHLVTVEAVTEMVTRLSSEGAILYHISNHHVDLLPVLNAIANQLNLGILVNQSVGDDRLHKYTATWVVMTANQTLLARLKNDFSNWDTPPPTMVLWRDEFSNIWSVIR